MRRGGVLPRPRCIRCFASGGLLSFPGEKREFRACGRGSLLAIHFFASGGLFSFSSERKEEKKRRQKLRFWISLRGFTWFYLVYFCHANVVPRKFHLNIALSLLLGALPLLL